MSARSAAASDLTIGRPVQYDTYAHNYIDAERRKELLKRKLRKDRLAENGSFGPVRHKIVTDDGSEIVVTAKPYGPDVPAKRQPASIVKPNRKRQAQTDGRRTKARKQSEGVSLDHLKREGMKFTAIGTLNQ